MIYCILKGGLANIMFQIAATTALAEKKNVNCCFPNYLKHLDYTNSRWHLQYNKQLDETFVNDAQEYKNFMNIDYTTKLPTHGIKMYKYPFHYADFLPEDNEFAIDGYFQSEKYFLGIRKKVLNMFKLQDKQEQEMLNKYKDVLDQNLVSIHVRRGDYLRYSQNHPLLSINYYEQALSKIENYDRCLVFSDDIPWCKENLNFRDMYFVENEKDYIEMFLMSKCKSNIIANSSFSWWGAWLNNTENKKVIAPKNWFGPGVQDDTKDLIPKNWELI